VRAPVDGNVEIALTALAIDGLQLRQMLDVDVCEAEVVVLERALALPYPSGDGRLPLLW